MKNHKKSKITAALLALTLAAAPLAAAPLAAAPARIYAAEAEEEAPMTFKPADLGLPAQEEYVYPYMGMQAAFSKDLLEKIKTQEVLLLPSERHREDGTIQFASLDLYALTEEQRNEELTSFDPEVWLAGLQKIGSLSICHKDSVKDLDTLTGCTGHTKLGESKDGSYIYHLSLSEDADSTLAEELKKLDFTVTEMKALDPSRGDSAFSEARVDAADLGDFKTTDIEGKEYTREVFQDYDLTLVNIFATWCSPCVNEMPELQKLYEEMADMGVGVVGLVTDAVNPDGSDNNEAIEIAKLLKEKAGLTFPLLKPEETQMNGRLKGINSFPETFFVDKDGNIVGETYGGSRDFDQWKEIAQKELDSLKGEEK